ncbi:MAG: hypothetical protein L3J52_00175 [Proteobacteria bacterium]|nr:hypothetical protein [Pseudomonadota bacterium]
MKTTNLFILIFIATISLVYKSINAQVLITDSFESLDMGGTNLDGFSWANNNRTSVVTQDLIDGPVAVYNNGAIYNIASPTMPDGSARNWTAFGGDYSLRFRYPAGETWAEQRFDLGGAYPDLWMSFWLRVPTNFKHGINPNTPNASNNKLFSIWMDGYETAGDGPTVTWNFWSAGAGGDSSELRVSFSEGGNTANGGQLQPASFITYPSDQGRWMQIVIHVVAATNASSNDGVIELSRRWDGDSAFAQLHLITDANIAIPAAGPEGWAAGYLMGWANARYQTDTEWLLDGIIFSETSLIDVIFKNSFD